MKIELLKEFLAFADCLSFSKAARRLSMTQPALSKHIRALEDELGYELVERGEQLRLTPAGTALVDGAFRTVMAYDEALASVAAAARAGVPVRIHEYVASGAERLSYLRSQTCTPIRVVPKRANTSIVELVADGQIDLALLPVPTIGDDLQRRLDDADIEALPLPPGRSSICMKATNPLAARRESLSRHDLEDVPIVVFSPDGEDEQVANVRAMLGNDLDLHFRWQPLESDNDIYLTDIGNGVHICGAEVNRRHLVYRDDMIVVEHLVDAELISRAWLIYQRGNSNPKVRELAQKLAELG